MKIGKELQEPFTVNIFMLRLANALYLITYEIRSPTRHQLTRWDPVDDAVKLPHHFKLDL